MKTHPIAANGQKVARTDLTDGWTGAGRADDCARAPLLKILVEDSVKRGYLVPWRDGPLVLPTGSGNGKVKVQPFTAIMSQSGAATNPGTELASDGSDASISAIDDIVSAWYPGGLSPAISVPLSGAGMVRWDLLYATIAQTDSDTGSRMVKNATTKVVSAQSVYTKHKSTVSLGWVQGVEVSNAAAQYPEANIPLIPTPAAGSANVPIALVQVRYAASMGTAQYTNDHIAECATRARINPNTGATVSLVAGVSGEATPTAVNDALQSAAVKIVSARIDDGGWPLTGANIRPQRFIEAGSGEIVLWIPVGPFSNSGIKTFNTSSVWTVLDKPITMFNETIERRHDAHPYDFRDRWFDASITGSATSTDNFAHATAGSSLVVPNALGAGNHTRVASVMGNSLREYSSIPGYRLAALFVAPGAAVGETLALLVKSSDGQLYLAGYCVGAVPTINTLSGIIRVVCSPRFMPVI